MIVKIMGAASTAKPYTGGSVYGIAYWFVLTYQSSIIISNEFYEKGYNLSVN